MDHHYSGDTPFISPPVAAPLLADRNISSWLHSNCSNQKQHCIMAPSIKQEPHYPGVTQPFIVNQRPWQISPPVTAKQEQSVPDMDLDDSLTSLNWLHDIKVMKFAQPTPPSSPTPIISYANHQPENLPTYIQKEQLRMMSESCGLGSHSVPSRTNSLQDGIDYRQNGCMKPPYSYATLIWMAMKDSKKSKITLSAIYKWITDNFKYYRTAEPSWQNSIRHNLSLNKCFERVARRKDEPGKGGFWRINPVHAELLESGIWKKRRAYSLPEMDDGPLKRIQLESLAQPCPDLPQDQPQDVLQVPSIDLPEDTLPQSGSDGEVFEIEVIHPKPEISKCKRKKSKSKKRSKTKRSKRSKRCKISHQDDSSTSEDDNLPSSVLNGNFQWDSIFDSEIEVDGIRVKAEAILNPNGEVQLLPVMDSPPSSEENEDLSMFLPLGESPLDLSIKGTHIPKPLWFEGQTETKADLEEQTNLSESVEELFGLPDLPPSPASSLNDQTTHPWAEDRDQVEDLYFEEFLNLQDSGSFTGASWAPDHAIQTVIIEK